MKTIKNKIHDAISSGIRQGLELFDETEIEDLSKDIAVSHHKEFKDILLLKASQIINELLSYFHTQGKIKDLSQEDKNIIGILLSPQNSNIYVNTIKFNDKHELGQLIVLFLIIFHDQKQLNLKWINNQTDLDIETFANNFFEGMTLIENDFPCFHSLFHFNSTSELREIIKRLQPFSDNCNLNWIDVSNITNMQRLFQSLYVGDISKWDVSNVQDMSYMFYYSKTMLIDISHWDVSHVTNMTGLFANSQFNDDISQWDTNNVENMSFMFSQSQFTGDISQWNVHNVINMDHMFYFVTGLCDLSKWDIYNVENMSKMFSQITLPFNSPWPDLSRWKINPLCDIDGMFYNANCPKYLKPTF